MFFAYDYSYHLFFQDKKTASQSAKPWPQEDLKLRPAWNISWQAPVLRNGILGEVLRFLVKIPIKIIGKPQENPRKMVVNGI